MRTILNCFCAFFFVISFSVCAADDARLTAVKAADDERVAATLAGDKARLTAIFSDDLRYAHSTGSVDTKASYIESMTNGKLKYLAIEYKERGFTFPAPGIALMNARVRLNSQSNLGLTDNLYSILAVWREEKGIWRFIAWQSCKLGPANPEAK